jgi:hypothetical protein
MRSGRFRAAVQEGALALENGWDPLRYLDLAGLERIVAKEVLQEAAERKADREKHFWKDVQAAVQNGVAKAFGAKK